MEIEGEMEATEWTEENQIQELLDQVVKNVAISEPEIMTLEPDESTSTGESKNVLDEGMCQDQTDGEHGQVIQVEIAVTEPQANATEVDSNSNIKVEGTAVAAVYEGAGAAEGGGTNVGGPTMENTQPDDLAGSTSSTQHHPDEFDDDEPYLAPINGVVRPNFIPRPDKLGRLTNHLLFMKNVVMKSVMRHEYSHIFKEPVDAVKLNIPDYHNIVRKPMDLSTIKKRLEHNYYWSAKQCINDFKKMFTNAYVYNVSEASANIVYMTKALEDAFLKKIAEMDSEEMEVLPPPVVPRQIKKRRSTGGGAKPKPTRPKSSRPKSKVQTHGYSASGSSDEDSSPVAIKKRAPKRKVSFSLPNRLENGSSPVTPAPSTSTAKMQRSKNQKSTGRAGNKAAAASSLALVSSNVSDMKLLTCKELLNDLLSEKYKRIAWPFYSPVDERVLTREAVPAYYEQTKRPMDLGTIKTKMDRSMYESHEEFAADIRLIIHNCLHYNPIDSELSVMARALRDKFEAKYARILKGKTELDTTNSEDESDSEDDSRSQAIALLEQQIHNVQQQISVFMEKESSKGRKKKGKK